MIDQAQTQIAKTLWEQSKTAAQQAHQSWDLVMKSQKTLMDSMRNVGEPYAQAADQFDKLMAFHAQQYKAAMEFMDQMSTEYQKLLEQPKKKK